MGPIKPVSPIVQCIIKCDPLNFIALILLVLFENGLQYDSFRH